MFKRNIHVLVLNYNGRPLLEKYLGSIVEASAHSIHFCRVSVVDNRSTDDSVQFLKMSYPDVGIYIARENRVLCSFNEVLKVITEEIVIFMNNDIYLPSGFIDPLISHFDDKSVFFTAPKECSLDGVFRGGINRGIFRFGFFRNVVKDSPPDRVQYTLSAHGAAFDRKKVLELGGFDDLYLPGYAEDLDLCYRGWKRGWVGLYEPESYMLHQGSASFNKAFGNNKKLVIVHRNNFLFFWKNITSKRQLAVHIALILPNLLFALFIGRWHFIIGFFCALRHIAQAISKRKAANGTSIISDETVVLRAEGIPFMPENAGSKKDEIRGTKERYGGVNQSDVLAANINYHNSIAKRYEEDASTIHIFDESGRSQKRIRNVLDHIKRSTGGGFLLDVGCGTGNVLKQAGGYFKKTVGADVSIEMLKISKERGLPVVLADSLNLPWPNTTFDAVSAFSVVHHFLNPSDLFKELYRVLKPGGFLYTDWDPNSMAMALFDEKRQSPLFKAVYRLYMMIKKAAVLLPDDVRQESGDLQGMAALAEYHHYKEGLDPDKIISDLKNLGFKDVKIYFHDNDEDLFKETPLKLVDSLKLMGRLLFNFRIKMPPSKERCAQFAIIAKK